MCGCTSDFHIKCIQTFQNRALQNLVNLFRYVSRTDEHRDLRMSTVKEEIKSLLVGMKPGSTLMYVQKLFRYWTVNIVCKDWKWSSCLIPCNMLLTSCCVVRVQCASEVKTSVCCIQSNKLKDVNGLSLLNKKING